MLHISSATKRLLHGLLGLTMGFPQTHIHCILYSRNQNAIGGGCRILTDDLRDMTPAGTNTPPTRELETFHHGVCAANHTRR